MTKAQQLEAVYRNTHSDFKGKIGGVRTIMVCRGGTMLVALENLTDQEIADRLPRKRA